MTGRPRQAWDVHLWEAEAGGGVLKAQRGRGRWAGKSRDQKANHAGGNNAATALAGLGQEAENGGGKRGL